MIFIYMPFRSTRRMVTEPMMLFFPFCSFRFHLFLPFFQSHLEFRLVHVNFRCFIHLIVFCSISLTYLVRFSSLENSFYHFVSDFPSFYLVFDLEALPRIPTLPQCFRSRTEIVSFFVFLVLSLFVCDVQEFR